MQINSGELIELIEAELEGIVPIAELRSCGTVVSVTDGILKVHGLEQVMHGEMVECPGGIYGIALNLEQDMVGIVVLGESRGISEGDLVRCTGKILEVPVGERLLGRVVTPLGRPIDGGGTLAAGAMAPIERSAAGGNST